MWFILTLIFSMLAGDVGWWVWARRRVRARNAIRWPLDLFMAIQVACLVWVIVGRLFSDHSDELMPRFLMAAVFVWHFLLLPVAILIIASKLAVEAIGLVRRKLRTRPPPAVEASPAEGSSVSRRDFLQTLTIAAPPLATAVMTGIALDQLSRFRVREFDLEVAGLPAALEGLTIAHVTDIHVGRFTGGAVLSRIVEQTNQLRADLVLLTGDLINHAQSDLPAAIGIVRRMDARFGVFMCEGNHDLLEGRESFERRVKQSGVPLLVDESAIIPIRGAELQLLGLRWAGRGDAGVDASVRALLPQRQAGAFPILMAHHPHAFDTAAAAGIPLTLAGHTHGGQLMASKSVGFGPLMFRYWSGLYTSGQSKLLVSNGVGNWFPLRINAPAEILHIRLHARI